MQKLLISLCYWIVLASISRVECLSLRNSHNIRSHATSNEYHPVYLNIRGGDFSKMQLNSLPLDLFAISSSNQWGLYAAVATAAALGLKLERSTKIGKALSGPVSAMLITSILTNVGILPSEGSMYISSLQSFVVKVATPLLLLGADVKKIIRETGDLMKAFILGSFATLFGSTISYLVFHKGLNQLGSMDDGWKIVSALTAKNIGGGLNFIAVADILKVTYSTIATGLAVDNIIGLMYFPFVSWLAAKHRNDYPENPSVIVENTVQSISSTDKIDVDSSVTALAVTLIIIAISEWLGTVTRFPAIIISTLLTVFLATVANKQFIPLVYSGETLGKLFLFLFFGSVGISSGKISSVIQADGTGSLFGFTLMMYSLHLIFITVIGKLNKISMPDILVASNANIGNAATASAFASSMGWKSRILPALLVGTFGNAIATFVAVWLGNTLLKSISSL